ncbi:O-antigen ligase family protein [Polaribacter sp. Asnod6-C07]|uniref:O-antigen ligase family protein n=1 Tax=Polaribacter sp. Asnod6-C07 TaxID=3160582 RepID=UPI003870310F
MIVLLLGFYGFAFLLAANRPMSFVLFYILASTKFLGYIDPATFIVGGIEVGYFGLNLMAIFGIFFKKNWVELPKNSITIIILIAALLIYGIARPIINDYSSVKQAVIASKDTWFYAIFIYLFVYYDNIDLKLLIKFIKGVSVYFTVNYLLLFVFPAIIPPFYDGGFHVRTFFPTYISLAIFLYLIEIKIEEEKSYKKYGFTAFLFLGLILAEHSALTVMTLLGAILYLFAFGEDLRFKRTKIAKLLSIGVFCISLALIFINGLYDGIVDKVRAVVFSEDLALSTRDLYNKFRWDAINDQKTFGYGFIHQSSSLMNQFKLSGTSAFMERFTVIDSGYVDLLIKFGYLGTGIMLAVLNRFFLFGFFRKFRNHITLAMSFYLIQYLFVNYTWSVYTFSHGIIPGAIAMYIIIMYQDLKLEDDKLELV